MLLSTRERERELLSTGTVRGGAGALLRPGPRGRLRPRRLPAPPLLNLDLRRTASRGHAPRAPPPLPPPRPLQPPPAPADPPPSPSRPLLPSDRPPLGTRSDGVLQLRHRAAPRRPAGTRLRPGARAAAALPPLLHQMRRGPEARRRASGATRWSQPLRASSSGVRERRTTEPAVPGGPCSNSTDVIQSCSRYRKALYI